jgi:hypothetical protein
MRSRSPFLTQPFKPTASQFEGKSQIKDSQLLEVLDFIPQKSPISFGRLGPYKWFVGAGDRFALLTSKILLMKIVERLTEREAQH